MNTAKILVFQTAFIGDVILTLPLIQVLHRQMPDVSIDVVAIPSTAGLLQNHPAINQAIVYDKRGADSGIAGAISLIRKLRTMQCDAALIPHRSLRSGLICFGAGIHRRIGFSTSAAPSLLTDVVPYRKEKHESVRVMSLLVPLQISLPEKELPVLYPGANDVETVVKILRGSGTVDQENMIAIAPGSEWATKRWLPGGFIGLAQQLMDRRFSVVLIGGKGDVELGHEIETAVGRTRLLNTMGKLSLLQSAELIRRCKVLVSNDSAPLHMGVAMRTPVVGIFGATVPEFGFAPLGEHDVVVQTQGLECRPCSIHGGDTCPIKTFVCMRNISPAQVLARVDAILAGMNTEIDPREVRPKTVVH